MLELIVIVISETQLWLLPTYLCHCSQGALQAPLCSSLQSRIAMPCWYLSWHPMGGCYLWHKAAKDSGELCASVSHPHRASQPRELLLGERKRHFSHMRLKFFQCCQRNSESGLNRALQSVNIQNCACVAWDLRKGRGLLLTSVTLILGTFFNLKQLKTKIS